MATISVKIPSAELQKALKNISNYSEETQSDIKKEIIAGAFSIETDAKKSAPVLTGRLRADISNGVTEGGFGARVFNTVEYAPHVEMGTSRQRAQPYLRPAYEKNIGKIEKRIANQLKKA